MSDYIPPELISNILARLPIADVLRSTSVCKSWYRLITSPSFISLHLNLSISHTESRLIVRFEKYGGKECCNLHRDNQAFDEIEELEPPRNLDGDIWIYGSSNGLFCCCSRNKRVYKIYGETLILWNPSLKKSLILPKSRDCDLSKHHQQHNVGFGFLPSSDNFKIVRVIYTQISYRNYTFPPEVEIYEFYTRSWRDVNASEFSYVLEDWRVQALLKGIVHWPARDPHRAYGKLIVSFDLTSEKFGTLMLPKCMQNDEGRFYNVYTWKESLCVVDMQNTYEQSSIFIMKEYGVTDSWEKLFNFGILDISPLYLRVNGQVLAGKLVDEESYKWNLVSCDPKSNEIMDLGVHKYGQYFSDGYAYVDNLFLIQDSNES